jgi:restriction endonuclease Mrr
MSCLYGSRGGVMKWSVGSRPVGSGAIRDFFDSLDRYKAAKGLFVTSATFRTQLRRSKCRQMQLAAFDACGLASRGAPHVEGVVRVVAGLWVAFDIINLEFKHTDPAEVSKQLLKSAAAAVLLTGQHCDHLVRTLLSGNGLASRR